MSIVPQILQAGALAELDHNARALIAREAKGLKLPAGKTVFLPGDPCHHYVIVTSGSIRVSVTTEGGREIVLYRVESGETCVLTAACLLSGASYEAEGRAETDTEAVILPKAIFDELLGTSALFRQFVFASYGERLHGLIALVQEIALRQVDRRLARFLLSEPDSGVVAMTHQAIAAELNTAREVVTRLLHDFAGKGWVVLERGRIRITNPPALQDCAGPL